MEIILIRHGKPAVQYDASIDASAFVKWVRQYNFSEVAEYSRPKAIDRQFGSYYVVSSDLKRAKHSSQIYTGRKPDLIKSDFREMHIPRYKLPFKCKAMTWVYLCRLLWMLGVSGPFESYQYARERAKLAAQQLIELATIEGKVVLFGHGYMNLHIRRALAKQGWKVHSKSNAYWGVSTLSFTPKNIK
jgi:broad specificity phosphatase PhoE